MSTRLPFAYDGPIYVRPLGRGICLYRDGELSDGLQLEELFDAGDYRASIRVVAKDAAPAEPEAVTLLRRLTGSDTREVYAWRQGEGEKAKECVTVLATDLMRALDDARAYLARIDAEPS